MAHWAPSLTIFPCKHPTQKDGPCMGNPVALEVKLTNSASKITNMNYCSYMQIKAHEQDTGTNYLTLGRL